MFERIEIFLNPTQMGAVGSLVEQLGYKALPRSFTFRETVIRFVEDPGREFGNLLRQVSLPEFLKRELPTLRFQSRLAMAS